MDLLGVFLLALIGGFLIGRAFGRREWFQGWDAGRQATHQVRWQHEDPTDSAGA